LGNRRGKGRGTVVRGSHGKKKNLLARGGKETEELSADGGRGKGKKRTRPSGGRRKKATQCLIESKKEGERGGFFAEGKKGNAGRDEANEDADSYTSD